ncbi:Uncharacterised protein at_DN0190 [Pycnogonum litorale]
MMMTALTDVLNGRRNNVVDKICRNLCKDSCDYSYFSTTTSTAAPSISKFTDKHWNTENIRSFITVYYPSLDVELHTDVNRDFFGIVSDIGGVASLFLGCSLITFAEVVQFIVRAVVKSFCCRPCRKTNKIEEANVDDCRDNIRSKIYIV